MELNQYGVIKKFVITDKTFQLFREHGKVTFEVDKAANRSVVRDAVEKIWDVKVEKVRILNTPGKRGTFARRRYYVSGAKRAIISLKDGYKIELPGLEHLPASSSSAHESQVVEHKEV